MCGICGVVALGRPAERATVEGMSRRLLHRGPDGSGSYATEEGVALGFRRLAIIDLSEAASQPFSSDDGDLRLVYNGEVYNYRELRRELEAHGHRFRSASDTEVVLRAYEQWGTRCVERFNGMWAFALWDGRERRLVCSRDRFGIKPFYYAYENGRFVFASEPQAFRGVLPLAPNRRVIRDFLELGRVDRGDETFFDRIRRLPSAHNLVLDDRGIRVSRYWSLEAGDPPNDPVEAVRETFLDAVRLHLRSDVPVGTCLSGGIDSSAIVVAVDHLLRTEHETAAAVGDRQRTYTAFFPDPGCDERPWAEAVVRQTSATPNWVTFDDEDLVATLPTAVESQSEPFGSTSIFAQWFVMREARESGVTVMLDGQGGDELFAGYDDYVGPYLADLLRRGRLPRFARDAYGFGSSPRHLAVQVARPFLYDRVSARRRSARLLAHPGLGEDGDRDRFPGTLRTMLDEMRTNELPKLLRYEDRNSMAHRLEARVPFLDIRLVELAASLPGTHLLRGGETKAIFRKALADLLPDSVRVRRDKIGFATPERRFFTGALGSLAEEVFASDEFESRELVDAGRARALLSAVRAGSVSDTQPVWRALNLHLWIREFCSA